MQTTLTKIPKRNTNSNTVHMQIMVVFQVYGPVLRVPDSFQDGSTGKHVTGISRKAGYIRSRFQCERVDK